MKAIFFLLMVMGAALISVIGGRYYMYATNTKTPFDEVGIELHQNMPAMVRDWGCAQLKQSFGGKTLPPPGCNGADPRIWR
jgi:hypothetical protein